MTPEKKIKTLSLLATKNDLSNSLFRLLTIFILFDSLEIAHFSQREFGKVIDKSVQTVSRLFKEAEDLNLITRHRYGYGKENTYSINWNEIDRLLSVLRKKEKG